MEEEVGKIIHYYDKLGVGVVEVTKGTLKVGDQIHIKGATTDFKQAIESLQIENSPVEEIGVGKQAGLKVSEMTREGDQVFKVS